MCYNNMLIELNVTCFLMYIHAYGFMEINSCTCVYVFINCLSITRYLCLAG